MRKDEIVQKFEEMHFKDGGIGITKNQAKECAIIMLDFTLNCDVLDIRESEKIQELRNIRDNLRGNCSENPSSEF